MVKGASSDSTNHFALSCDAELFSQQGLSSGGAETHQNSRLHNEKFSGKPRATCVNLRSARLLMDASLAALSRRPLKIFHDIRDVDLGDLFKPRRALHPEVSRRSDKWLPHTIFLISRLFAYEHDCGFGCSLSNTVGVAVFQRSHALQMSALSRRLLIVDSPGV
jgi:hypothetical protein